MEEACLLLVKVALGWHRDAEGEHLFRREAGVDLKGVVEALDEQASLWAEDWLWWDRVTVAFLSVGRLSILSNTPAGLEASQVDGMEPENARDNERIGIGNRL